MSLAIRVLADPNDPERRYVLYTNGRVRPSGSNPPPEHGIGDDVSGYGTGKQPLVNPNREAEHLFQWFTIYNWNADPPTGHLGDRHGRVFTLGDAPEVPQNQQPVEQIFPWKGIIDAVMNPAGTGEGYATTTYGGIYTIGGAVSDIANEWFNDAIIRRIVMPDWATKKYALLTVQGQRLSYNGAVQLDAHKDFGIWGVVNFGPYDWLSGAWEAGRSMVITNSLDAGEGDGFAIIGEGYVYSLNDAQFVYGEPRTDGNHSWFDVIVLDDGSGPNPLRLLTLNMNGAEADFVVSTPPVVMPANAMPEAVVTNTTRPTFAFSYSDREGDARDYWQFRLLNDAQYGVAGTNEVQRITLTGTPTGGGVRLVVNGQTTAQIARNATAATVKAAIEALINVEVNDVAATGGPWPGVAIDITFQNGMGKHPIALMGGIDELTGGVNPDVSVSRITAGVAGVDPDSGSVMPVWEEDIPMPEARNVSSRRIKFDLPNDTYRIYARARDTAGQWSEWGMRQFTMNVVAPAAVSVTPGAPDPITGIPLLLDSAAVTPNALYYLEFSDTPTDPDSWLYVRGGFGAQPNVGTGEVTVIDREATYNVQRSYRAKQLTIEPWLAGPYGSIATATLTASIFSVIDPYDPTKGMAVDMMEWELDEEVIRGIFQPDYRPDNVIITSENAVKFPHFPLKARTLTKAIYDSLVSMIRGSNVLLVRNYDGESYYIMVSDTIKRTRLRGRPTPVDTAGARPLRHAYELSIPVHATRRPLEGPVTGDLALTG